MPEFDVLMFTDCRAGEGVLGREGLQFRTASPGGGPEARAVVERHCLYEPPDEWLRTRRSASTFPRSLAHIADGRYATASGTYLGTEAKGSRQGNHFTHALVTTDADAYGQLRPAQLWGSPVWRSSWDGPTTCPPEPAEPPGGLFDPLTLQRWVAGNPGGEAMLVAVLSGLRGALAGGRRVLFVSTEPEPVLAWLAAATLLMPRADALRVGFKVYVNNADYSAHHAVAVHPDWAPAYRGAPDGTSFAVFDLDATTYSTVPPDDAALFWTPRFLTGDCFDVLDAVELSGSLRHPDATSGDDTVERIVAAALVLGERAGTDTSSVVTWLGQAADRLTTSVVETLTSQLLDGPLGRADMDVLRLVAARSRRRDHLTLRVLARTASLVTGRPVDTPRDAAGATATVEHLLVHAGATEVPELLALAADHGLEPDPSAFPDALNAFVRWWTDNPGPVRSFTTWSCRETVLDLLRDQLGARIRSAATPAAVASIGDTWWSLLLPTFRDPRSPLDAAVASATMREADQATRRWMVSTVLWMLPPGGADTLTTAWDALYRDTPPTTTELVGLLALAGPGPLPGAVADGLEKVLSGASAPGVPEVAVLDRLIDLGHTTSRDPLPGWQEQAMAVRSAVGRIAALPTTDAPDDPAVADVAATLAAAPVGFLTGRSVELVDAMRRPHPRVVAALVGGVPQPQRGILLAALADALATGLDDRIAASCLILVGSLDRIPLSLWRRLAEQRRRRTDGEVHRVAGLLADDDERTQWWALDPEKPPRRGVLNPFRRNPR